MIRLSSARRPLGLLAFALGILAPLSAAPHPAPASAWTNLPTHPRLFANADQWQTLRARLSLTASNPESLAPSPTSSTTADLVSARLFALIRARAESILALPPVVIAQRKRGALAGTILEPAREIQRRVLALAATARLTGDARFRDRALAEIRLLTALPDWNPAVFLDTAEATLAVAVGYDWLYDTLTPVERDTLASALIEKGLRASFDSPAKFLSWVRGSNNWNQVCHGALVIGALAVADREPALAQRTVQRAIDELHSSAKAYAPDGVYPEGPMYWAYGTTFHVAMLAALESALGDRCGLDEFPGFLATPDYLNQVTAPGSDTFNYADSSAHRGFEPALFWFARRLRQPAAIRWELDYLGKLAAAAKLSSSSDARSRHLPLALLWWDPALAALPAAPPPLNWKGEGPVPIAVHRSAWSDPRAVYVAIKGGKPAVSHGHMDVGSFILEADGVRWAVDAGSQSYTTAYQAGIDSTLWSFKQDSPRWTIFRLGPEGHNLLRFDGAPQRVTAFAPITRFVATGPDAAHPTRPHRRLRRPRHLRPPRRHAPPRSPRPLPRRMDHRRPRHDRELAMAHDRRRHARAPRRPPHAKPRHPLPPHPRTRRRHAHRRRHRAPPPSPRRTHPRPPPYRDPHDNARHHLVPLRDRRRTRLRRSAHDVRPSRLAIRALDAW
jgi:hypothetical protein